MSARPFYETVYHRKDYRLSDAFRPNSNRGRRSFTVALAALGEHTEDEMLTAAKVSAPEGYRLTELSVYPAEGARRIIWSTPPVERAACDTTKGEKTDG